MGHVLLKVSSSYASSSSPNRRHASAPPTTTTTKTKAKKRKGIIATVATATTQTPTLKKLKKVDSPSVYSEDDKYFPSLQEMEESRNQTMEKLPQDMVYQIMSAESKEESYNGEAKNNLYINLRMKGESKTTLIRATELLKSKLCGEERYMERIRTHRFYFLSTGWKTSKAGKDYRDFIIKSIKM